MDDKIERRICGKVEKPIREKDGGNNIRVC